MKTKPILSICIPVFNRKKKILELLKSIDSPENLEIVIFDDGSTDGIEKKIKSKNFKFKLKFYKTTNRGRSSALADAIIMSSGSFVIIMDSDDYFLPGGIDQIKKTILQYKNIYCFLFGVKVKKKNFFYKKIPPNNLKANLLKLRADYKIRGDMKEVVKSQVIKKCIYKKSYAYRRTPTSLIWECISRKLECLTISKCIVVKEYDNLGMTASISNIKYDNSVPMMDLYERYSNSKLYSSRLFRIKSKIQFYRYSFISKSKKKMKLFDIFFLISGFFLYFFDYLKYQVKKNYSKC